MKHLFFVVFVFAIVAPLQSAEKPNVILLLADDLGYSGLTCYGSDLYQTPNLDALAQQGLKFTSAYSACTVCSPTRASIMTGKYPARLHLTDFIAGQSRPYSKLSMPDWTKRLEPAEVTIAEHMQKNGYSTAHFGKWHLEPKNDKSQDFSATGHGFDVSVSRPKGAKGYFINQKLVDAGHLKSGYLTDHLTDKAVELIDEWKAKPFFIYFAYNTPHTPIQGKPELVKAYKAKLKPGLRHDNPTFAAMVHSLDESVGRVIAAVEEAGLTDSTVIWFVSDNGGLSIKFNKPTGFTDNQPLRRGKGSAYEGGTRVPMIVKWPGLTAPATVTDEPVCTIDILPTVLNLTNSWTDSATQSANDATGTIDGQSLESILRNPAARLDRDALYWHYPHYHAGGNSPYSAIRARRYRLVEFFEDGRLELYDLQNDIGERDDLAKAKPKLVEKLHGQLKAWRSRVNAQLPTLNPNYDPEKAKRESSGGRTAKSR